MALLSNAGFGVVVVCIASACFALAYVQREPKGYNVITVNSQSKKDTATQFLTEYPNYEVGKLDSSKRLIVSIKPIR